MTYHIIAYPRGVRTIVGIAPQAIPETVIAAAQVHARVRGEFAETSGEVAVVGPNGPVAS